LTLVLFFLATWWAGIVSVALMVLYPTIGLIAILAVLVLTLLLISSATTASLPRSGRLPVQQTR
jgi:hypothetical protein